MHSMNIMLTPKSTLYITTQQVDIISPPTVINTSLPPHSLLTFSFLVSFEKFHVTAASKAGFNKIYEFRHSKSFFFEVIHQLPDTNEIHLKIYTNDYNVSSIPIQYYSTSKLPNHRFQISKCLTHFFYTNMLFLNIFRTNFSI
jgi:hypothetical protein